MRTLRIRKIQEYLRNSSRRIAPHPTDLNAVFESVIAGRSASPLEDMMDRPQELVRVALALHLDMDVAGITADSELENDLGMDPLDLVLVVLRLEEIEESEFPIAELEGVTTVGELTGMIRSWMRPRSAPRKSGVRLLVEDTELLQEAINLR